MNKYSMSVRTNRHRWMIATKEPEGERQGERERETYNANNKLQISFFGRLLNSNSRQCCQLLKDKVHHTV